MAMPPRPNLELTTAQKQVYDFYRAYIDEHGVAPPVALMVDKLKMQRSSVYDVLGRLEDKGYLRKKAVTVKRLMPVKRKL
jgi:SOS-response transcriptional repressor LexA